MKKLKEGIQSKNSYYFFIISFLSFVDYFNFSLFGIYNIYINTSIFDSIKNRVLLINIFYSLGFLTKPLGALLAGFYGDIYGLKKSIIGIVIAMSIGTLFIGLCPSFNNAGSFALIQMIIGRSLQGIAYGGALTSSILAAVDATVTKNKSSQIGTIISSTSTAALFSYFSIFILSHYMPKNNLINFGWRIIFLFGGILSLLSLLLILKNSSFVNNNKSKVNRIQMVDLIKILKSEYLNILFAIGFSLFSSVLLTNFIFYPNLLNQHCVLNLDIIYRASTISLIFSILISILGGFLLNYVKTRKVMLLLYLLFILSNKFLFAKLQNSNFLYLSLFFIIQQGFISILFVCDYSIKYNLFSNKLKFTAISIVSSIVSTISSFLPIFYNWLIVKGVNLLVIIPIISNFFAYFAIITVLLLYKYRSDFQLNK